MAPPTEILEVALEKEEATRKKEMAMPVVQRERLERLDVFDLRMGVELIKQWSGDFAEPADFDPDKEPRHGDAEQQPVPDGADETDRSLSSNNACPESRASWSEVGLCSGETNASKKGGRGSGQNADDGETKNASGKQRGRNREEEGGTSNRFGIGGTQKKRKG